MAKRKTHEIDSREKYRIVGNFFEIVSSLKSKNEVVNFFVGLLTPSEALMIARRIQIAQLLLEKESYEKICKKLKVGSQTVVKTDKWLHKGDDKHINWLDKCLKRKTNNMERKNTSMLDKYVQHRIFKDLFN